jgi:hypothetical protein
MPLPYDPIPRADLKLPPTATEAELQSEILLLRDSFDNADRWWREAAAEADTLRAERDALAARVERLEGALRLVIIKPGEAGLFHATSPDMPGLFVSGTSVEEVSAAVPAVIAALSTDAQGPQEG